MKTTTLSPEAARIILTELLETIHSKEADLVEFLPKAERIAHHYHELAKRTGESLRVVYPSGVTWAIFTVAKDVQLSRELNLLRNLAREIALVNPNGKTSYELHNDILAAWHNRNRQ